MRITCVIGTLAAGGAERMMTYLCNGLAARGHQITLLTLDERVPDFYSLSPAVKRVRLGLPAWSFLGALARFYHLTRAVRGTRPQVVISFMTLSVLAACLCLRIPYIYADHLDVRYLTYSCKWRVLRNLLLRFASTVTVLSQRDLQFIQHKHPAWRAQVVYNPALAAPAHQSARPDFFKPGYRYVLAVGRLVAQKGFDRLLEAWGLLEETRTGWRLAIIGQGEDEASLKQQAQAFDCVDFIPPQSSIFPAYQHADVLAMSSRAEGFPLVLLEAMACGLPAVSFACTGPDVIIRNGVDGVLVEPDNIQAFASALARLMQEEPLRRALAARAPEVVERFSLNNYLDAYENLCKQAVL